jgi:hypothetical protein
MCHGSWIGDNATVSAYIPPELLDRELLRRTAQERLDGFVVRGPNTETRSET